MAADGTVTGTGTKWQSSLSLIRPGATIMFLSSPIQMAVVNKVVSDTEIKAITTNGAVVASTDYAILLSDSLTVDGLAQDVAETLRYYQSQETVIADAVEFFKEFDFESLQNLANQIKADSEAAEDSATSAAASESAAKTSETNAKESENAAKTSEVAAETARDQVQQIINDAGEQSTLVVLAQPGGFNSIGQVASYAALKNITPYSAGQRILLASYYANGSSGGGEFVARAGTATDDGGTICVPTGSSTWYWQRVSLSDFNVSWFGAVGDSSTDNTTAIQNAMNAASSYGIATVRFPASTGFFKCGTIYVPAGVTMMGSNRSKSLYGATVYLRKGSNAVVSPAFEGLWTKQSYFRLWDPDNTGSMISNVWFTNCLIDGTNLALAGKSDGDAIQVRYTTFDVHLKGTYIQNYLGAGYSAVSDNTATSYLATGVFCTLSQCKIFNCGYGIYLKGAAADSSDYHLDMVLLDHNNINLYVDGTRSAGMGECHVYARNCRSEWATTYSIYNKDGFVNFDGWSLAPGSGGQKIFTSSNGKTSINGRLSGIAEGEDASVDGNLVAHPGIISNLTYDKASPVVPLMLNNTTRGSIQKLQALKFKLAFSGASGFTFQNLVTYVSGNAPRFGIGGMYDTSVSAAVLGTTPVSVGSGKAAISAYTANSGISLTFGGGNKFSFVGMPSINRNTTGTAVNVSIQTDNTGKIIGIVFFNAATGAYVNPLSLTGEIQFSFVMFADL